MPSRDSRPTKIRHSEFYMQPHACLTPYRFRYDTMTGAAKKYERNVIDSKIMNTVLIYY
jgi:hypothetical protein